MPAGVEIVIEDGFATVTPDRTQRGHVLRALLAAVDHPSQIRTDTSGTRRSYVVLEQDAREAGLLDVKITRKVAKPERVLSPEQTKAFEDAKSEPAKATPAKKAPAKKAAPAKTADKTED